MFSGVFCDLLQFKTNFHKKLYKKIKVLTVFVDYCDTEFQEFLSQGVNDSKHYYLGI